MNLGRSGVDRRRLPGAICYVGQTIPSVTTTFVEQEIRGLRARGVDVVVCSNRRSDATELAERSRALLDEVVSVFPLSIRGLVAAHGRWLLRHPIRYATALVELTVAPHRSWHERLKTVAHFAGAALLAHRVRRRGIVHVHAHFTHNPATFAYVMSRLLDVSYSLTVHSKFVMSPPALVRKLDGAVFIAVISEWTRRGVIELAPDVAERTHLVHCGVDSDVFRPANPPIGNEHALVVAVGQLVEKKGHDVLIDALARLHSEEHDVRLVVVGEGPQRQVLERRITSHGLDQVVRLVGAASPSEVLAWLQRADVVALACRQADDGSIDGVPVALMEAMACGRAVVSTPLGGIPELIEDRVSGLLVPPDDEVALADALTELLEDPELRALLGGAARRAVVREWALDAQIESMLEMFAEVVGTR